MMRGWSAVRNRETPPVGSPPFGSPWGRSWAHGSGAGLALPLALVFAACGGGEEPAPDPSATFEAIVAEAREAAESPGLSAAVAVNGEIVWTGASGLADIENGVPATADSVYRIASISKPIAAVAIMQLAEQESIALDAPVQETFPVFPEKEYPVTLRHLLTHTSGIRHYNPGEFDMKERFDTIEAAIEIFKDDPLLFEPDTDYSYSTYAYNLLAGVVESASGMSFEQYMQVNVWGPAEMDNTHLEHQREIVPHRVRQYVKRDGEAGVWNAPLADLSIKWAGGGMIATATDLVRFALAMDAGTLMDSRTQAAMTTRHVLADGAVSDYALGWRIAEDEAGTWVAHSGGATGGTTHLLRLPERGLAVALTANVQSGAGLPDAARRLADAALAMGDSLEQPATQ